MVRLLISVRDSEEAMLALAAGVDLIDFKDPEAGALGALDPARIAASLGAIAGRRPTSATTGDLPADPDILCAAAGRIAATGVDYVKVGLWPGPLRAEAIARLGMYLSGRTRLIGVLIADADAEPATIPALARAGFAGVMLDVARKGTSLLHLRTRHELARFVGLAREHGLLCGLAGSLRIGDIAPLARIGPDVLGFRGGLCRALDRRQPLDATLVAAAVAAVRSAQPMPAVAS